MRQSASLYSEWRRLGGKCHNAREREGKQIQCVKERKKTEFAKGSKNKTKEQIEWQKMWKRNKQTEKQKEKYLRV